MFAGQRVWIFAAGFAAGLLYILAVMGSLSSVLLIYTPFIPLLMLGLSQGAQPALLASGVASVISGLALGPMAAFVFLMLFAGPCVLYAKQVLQRITQANVSFWFSQGEAMVRLSYYVTAMVVFMTVTLYNATDGTGMMALFPPAVVGEPEWMELARQWLAANAYMILGGTAWIQLSVFYGIAVLANFLLVGYGAAQRPNLTLLPFTAGGELLIALLGAGILSFVSNDMVALAAKSAFIALLYPYFLMGISRMHRYSLLWPSRRFWLTMVYFFMLMTFPILLLGFVGLGLAAQARHLSNRSAGSGQAS